MGRRRQAREIALQALYLMDISSAKQNEAIRSASRPKPAANKALADENTLAFARDLVIGTIREQTQIDEQIETAAENWRMSRMASVDRSLLRLATYEIIFCSDTPIKVILDEAIEIARKFSTEESTKFINGVLDKIKGKRSNGPKES